MAGRMAIRTSRSNWAGPDDTFRHCDDHRSHSVGQPCAVPANADRRDTESGSNRHSDHQALVLARDKRANC
eukprot:2671132-Rhodomonas_salina.2